ncbi:sphinganine C(4)-monooxygenase 1-like protein [Carex littledalei]|uniref:aldehyde oxygenase (deformylating) n=1 Tax=Carex littledalei TaxID=544730 RepID=A0A833VB14_9POAL|nr:sphinganine C(4)-monooxygenase 1-like protein [Carex littledalei]
MAFTLDDEVIGSVIPVAVYWIYSGIFVILGDKLDNYRLHSKAEEDAKNIVSKWTVVKGVLIQQAIQIVVSVLILALTKDGSGVPKPNPPMYIIALQFLVGAFVLDTWQYFMHRYLHINKFLYKHLHSTHHMLVVPYAYGTLYNHPLEGLLMDTIGGILAFLVSGMTESVGVFFFSFVTIKAVDVHTGVWWPYNIFHFFSPNTSAYHDVHHQLYGTKFNYAQPFFISWDKIMGTYMPFSLEKRKEGGYTVRPIKD